MAFDEHGFVTDNVSFLEAIAKAKVSTPEGFAQAILKIAHEKIGDRLIRVEGKLLSHDLPIFWGTKAPKLPKNLDWDVKEGSVTTKLVDNAICGGFDGRFICDLQVSANMFNKNKVSSTIVNRFDNGMYKASCEELCHGLCRATHDVVGTTLNFMVARVYNRTGYAETLWVAGMELPTFPREATDAEREETERNERKPERRHTVTAC